MIKILCLICASISGTITESETTWAFDYIQETVEGVEKPLLLPDGYKITFPDEYYEGYYIKNNKHGLKWWSTFVPLQGTILVKSDWSFGSIKDRAILIHEACHALDTKTIAGCRCDPYFLQYIYLIDNEYPMEQIRILYNFTMHDPSRKCYLKIKK